MCCEGQGGRQAGPDLVACGAALARAAARQPSPLIHLSLPSTPSLPPPPPLPAAVSLGIACGVPLKAVVAGVEAVDIVPGRCEIIDEGQPFAVVVSAA